MSFPCHLSTRHLTLIPSHLITLSARNSTDCGIVRLSASAVFRIDYKFELRRLLDGEVRGLDAFQNFVHVDCCALEVFSIVGCIRMQAPPASTKSLPSAIKGSRFFVARLATRFGVTGRTGLLTVMIALTPFAAAWNAPSKSGFGPRTSKRLKWYL